MRRREFIAGLGGLAVWPRIAHAQQPGRMRRIGVLMAYEQSDPEVKAWLAGFTQVLAELGWTDGRNLRMDVRWAAGSVDRMRMPSASTSLRRVSLSRHASHLTNQALQ
jgi:putative tryptophan/tyrosine transport system substrate-binding protein